MADDMISGLIYPILLLMSEILSWPTFGNQCCISFSLHSFLQQILIVSLLYASHITGGRLSVETGYLYSVTQLAFYHDGYPFERAHNSKV